MEVLAHAVNCNRLDKGYFHAVYFEFMKEHFIAEVFEDEEITTVTRCYTLQDELIDIPAYFGTGFASKVFTLIYDQVEKGERK